MSFFDRGRERIFWENAKRNADLAKRKTKPKILRIGRRVEMKPDEVVERLKVFGVDITRRSLFSWEKAGLVPEATRGNLGRGKGRTADYPEETVAEAVAYWVMTHGYIRIAPKEVSRIRQLALETASKEEIIATDKKNELLINKWMDLRNRVLTKPLEAQRLIGTYLDFWLVDAEESGK